MSGSDDIGSDSSERTDWSSVREAMSRMAAAREPLATVDHAFSRVNGNLNGADGAPNAAAVAPQDIIPLHEEQLAAVAEIERASSVLRRLEPALEIALPNQSAREHGRSYWSVWIVIAAIWVSAMLLVACATAAILYLLG
jgi:hypothetical protein